MYTCMWDVLPHIAISPPSFPTSFGCPPASPLKTRYVGCPLGINGCNAFSGGEEGKCPTAIDITRNNGI